MYKNLGNIHMFQKADISHINACSTEMVQQEDTERPLALRQNLGPNRTISNTVTAS